MGELILLYWHSKWVNHSNDIYWVIILSILYSSCRNSSSRVSRAADACMALIVTDTWWQITRFISVSNADTSAYFYFKTFRGLHTIWSCHMCNTKLKTRKKASLSYCKSCFWVCREFWLGGQWVCLQRWCWDRDQSAE